MKNKIALETYFSGTLDEWRNQLDEAVIDSIIKILSLDPKTEKENLWDDLTRVVYAWGKPSATSLKTSPANLKKYAADLNNMILKTLKTLKEMEYGPLFEKGTMKT